MLEPDLILFTVPAHHVFFLPVAHLLPGGSWRAPLLLSRRLVSVGRPRAFTGPLVGWWERRRDGEISTWQEGRVGPASGGRAAPEMVGSVCGHPQGLTEKQGLDQPAAGPVL